MYTISMLFFWAGIFLPLLRAASKFLQHALALFGNKCQFHDWSLPPKHNFYFSEFNQDCQFFSSPLCSKCVEILFLEFQFSTAPTSRGCIFQKCDTSSYNRVSWGPIETSLAENFRFCYFQSHTHPFIAHSILASQCSGSLWQSVISAVLHASLMSI